LAVGVSNKPFGCAQAGQSAGDFIDRQKANGERTGYVALAGASAAFGNEGQTNSFDGNAPSVTATILTVILITSIGAR